VGRKPTATSVCPWIVSMTLRHQTEKVAAAERGEPRSRPTPLGRQVACLGNPDPVGMKVYAPVGEETFEDIQTTEEAQAGADRREAA